MPYYCTTPPCHQQASPHHTICFASTQLTYTSPHATTPHITNTVPHYSTLSCTAFFAGVFADSKRLAQVRYVTAITHSLDYFQRVGKSSLKKGTPKHHVLELTARLPDGTEKSWSMIQIAKRLESVSKFGVATPTNFVSNKQRTSSNRTRCLQCVFIECTFKYSSLK